MERDIKDKWMEVLWRKRMSESREENGHSGGVLYKTYATKFKQSFYVKRFELN